MSDDPFLTGLDDKIPFFRVFAQRLRDGRSSRSGNPITAGHLADEIYHVVKTFQELGAKDPRRDDDGRVDVRYKNLITAYRNEDPAPTRVKPIPIQVLHQAQRTVSLCTPGAADYAVMDLIWIAFFFLLRPGEYVLGSETTPLVVQDVSLMVNAHKIDPFLCPLEQLFQVTHATITFPDQKNRVKGETIGHACSGQTLACPVRALVRRLHCLRLDGAPVTTPLCAYYVQGRMYTVKHAQLAAIIKTAAASLPTLNYLPSEYGPRSLRSGGAMALLCGQIDTDIIKLVGRWKSDAIFRYLHAQALPVVSNLSRTMVAHGQFTLLPGSNVPPTALPLIQQYDHLAQQVDLST